MRTPRTHAWCRLRAGFLHEEEILLSVAECGSDAIAVAVWVLTQATLARSSRFVFSQFSKAVVSRETGVPEDRVEKCLQALEKYGWIEIEHKTIALQDWEDLQAPFMRSSKIRSERAKTPKASVAGAKQKPSAAPAPPTSKTAARPTASPKGGPATEAPKTDPADEVRKTWAECYRSIKGSADTTASAKAQGLKNLRKARKARGPDWPELGRAVVRYFETPAARAGYLTTFANFFGRQARFLEFLDEAVQEEEEVAARVEGPEMLDLDEASFISS